MAEPAHLDSSAHTREKILVTAAQLFSRQGYTNTALSQVAREANVSKALVLWHFESKENLFRAALGRTLEPYSIDVLDDLEGLDEAAQIERLIDQVYEFVGENSASVRFLMSLIVRGESHPDETLDRVNELYRVFRGLLADVIATGRRSGRFRADIQPQGEAALILASLAGILIERFLGDELAEDPSRLLACLKRTSIGRLLA
jgi:TetR/AcrR family transcriptional regulator, transcriptional repressor for nem operon